MTAIKHDDAVGKSGFICQCHDLGKRDTVISGFNVRGAKIASSSLYMAMPSKVEKRDFSITCEKFLNGTPELLARHRIRGTGGYKVTNAEIN